MGITVEGDDHVTDTINRFCDQGNDPRDEFSIEAARRIMENIEW